jgi:tetratricopeptide (TPR) repeat protein
LEGSVRRAGEAVRITAQLIDAQTDAHLWSETYDRPLTTATVFAIQDEIANAIVDRLTTAMRVGANAASKIPRKADTENVAAYDLYLKGRALFMARGADNLEEAARVLDEAIELDPEFVRAWELPTAVYSVSSSWGPDPAFSETERKEALAIVDAAPPGWFYEYETRLLLRDYDRIRPERNVDTLLYYREDAGFLKSEARKKLMRQYRLPDYWRKHGFPPQCRAVGPADFACD